MNTAIATEVQEQQAEDRARTLAAVEALLPDLRARVEEAKSLRRLPDETVSALKRSGYFRVLQPKRHQGFELDPQDFCRLNMMLGEACMSTGWVGGVVGVHPFQLALFDERAQEEVWADDPDCLMSSSYAPVAKVEPVNGGFKFSGRWGWSSGCDHCEWALLGGIVPQEGYRTFLVPRSDYLIDDTWHVMGLQGTGSKDVVVEETFVPDYRTHRQMDGFQVTNPGNAINTAPLFRLPWGQVFVRAVNTSTIGGMKTMLALFIEGAKGKASSDPAKLAGDLSTQELIAYADSSINELEAVLYRNLDQMMDCLNADEPIPMSLRIRARYQAAIVIDRCREVASRLFSVAGGRAVFNGSRIQQHLLDTQIARAHVANNPTMFARNYGAVQLGMDNADWFV